MSYLLDASAPVSALCARPYDVPQLDNHPDAARLWATIVAVREECSSESEEALNVKTTEIEDAARAEGVADTLDNLSRLKLSLSETDGFLSIEHNLHSAKLGDLGATLNDPLDDLAGALNDHLGDLATDLASLAAVRANGAAALDELRKMIEGSETLAGIDWRTMHDLQQGRIRADALSKALKKDDLAYIAMLAMSALNRFAKV